MSKLAKSLRLAIKQPSSLLNGISDKLFGETSYIDSDTQIKVIYSKELPALFFMYSGDALNPRKTFYVPPELLRNDYKNNNYLLLVDNDNALTMVQVLDRSMIDNIITNKEDINTKIIEKIGKDTNEVSELSPSTNNTKETHINEVSENEVSENKVSELSPSTNQELKIEELDGGKQKRRRKTLKKKHNKSKKCRK